MALAVLELALEKVFVKKIHTISLFNFFLILFLGGLSLIGDEGIWFKLQPSFTGVGVGLFIFMQKLRGKSLFQDLMNEMPQKNNLPEDLMKTMELHIGCLFGVYGIFMAFVALYLETGQWVFFKTIGFYITFFIFLIGEMIFLRRSLKKRAEFALKQEILKKNI